LEFQFGPEAAPASPLAQRESSEAPTTAATCGQSSDASSPSVVLQLSLANRLRQNLEGLGSPLHALTWKHWDMLSGPPICALRARGHRTSDSGCSGWPTGTAHPDGKSPEAHLAMKRRIGERDGTNSNRTAITDLQVMANFAGWATPQARDHFSAHSEEYIKAKKAQGHGMANLNDQAVPAGWPTPATNDTGQSVTARQGSENLSVVAIGAMSNLSPAETEKPGQLNPEFVCWLMGYPAEWLSCVDWETRSSRKSRRNS